jgi:hypothetical protein
MSSETVNTDTISSVPVISGRALRDLEGREVSLSMADGSRLDAVTLVSAGRGGTPTVWIYAGGIDVFVPRPNVIDVWECRPVAAA